MYAALEEMLEEEERSRSQADAEETELPCEMAKDRYDGATEEDAEQNTLSTCGDRTAKDKAEIPIADSESGVRRFRACQLKTLDIAQANLGGVCAIGKKTTTSHEEPVAMDKGTNQKDNSTRLPALAPETMAAGPERPREFQEEEGGG